MYGFNGRIARIDLTNRTHVVETKSEDYYQQFGGGRGIIIHGLLTEVSAKVDPLGPENKLIFAPGILTGNRLPGSGRNSIGSKSPLTGRYGEAEVGGFWGAELKRSGYDAIIVEGTSPSPAYVWINNGTIEIRDANNIWGLDIADADEAIKKELGDNSVRTTIIGPGGEKKILFACIANDVGHFAGRNGLGAVMGSKRLKAIAVHGSNPPAVANPTKIIELSRWMGKNFREKVGNIHRIGTGWEMDYYEKHGNLPIRNFNGGCFPQVFDIMPQRLYEKGYVRKKDTCFACPIRCKRVVSMDGPLSLDNRYGGPEYETLAAFGSNCCVTSIETLMKANEICARKGIDTISTGLCISFAMECYERGLITKEDTDGIDMTFGNAEALLTMVEKIANRHGFGDILADGTKRAAERIGRGAAEYAIQVKGLELPMHEPRFKQGMGLHYSVHAGGPDHCSGIHDDMVTRNMPKGTGLNEDGTLTATEMSPRKARLLWEAGYGRQLANYTGLCILVPWSIQQVTEAVEAASGWRETPSMLPAILKRGLTLMQIYNLREGFSHSDDILPRRFLEKAQDGPLKEVFIDPDRLEKAQQAYFDILGWDAAGIPTRKSIEELDIEWADAFLHH